MCMFMVGGGWGTGIVCLGIVGGWGRWAGYRKGNVGGAGVRTNFAACIPSQVEASLMRTLSLEMPASL